MNSQMNLVHNAARLAMADHRAAMPRRPSVQRRGYVATVLAAVASLTAVVVWFFSRVSEPG